VLVGTVEREGSVLVGTVSERERSVLVGTVRARERNVLVRTVTERERELCYWVQLALENCLLVGAVRERVMCVSGCR